MDIGAWFIERRESTGICLKCGRPFANIEDSEGDLLDDLLEEGQPLFGCRPVQLTADDVHSKAILGEWCTMACFEWDLRQFFIHQGMTPGKREGLLQFIDSVGDHETSDTRRPPALEPS